MPRDGRFFFHGKTQENCMDKTDVYIYIYVYSLYSFYTAYMYIAGLLVSFFFFYLPFFCIHVYTVYI